MEILNQEVVHRRFGAGKILSEKDNTITVYFAEYGARSFIYPDAFDIYLKAKDDAFAAYTAERLTETKKREAERAAALTEYVRALDEDKQSEKRLARADKKKPAIRAASVKSAAKPVQAAEN